MPCPPHDVATLPCASFQRKILWYILPTLGLLALVTWLQLVRQEKTFHIAPPVEAGVVREMLLDHGFREVPRFEDASVVWTDADSAKAMGKPAHRQLHSVLSTHMDARPDGTCRSLTTARRLLGGSAEAAGVRVVECYVLPQQAMAAQEAMAAQGGFMWEVEPVDQVAQGLALENLGKPIPAPPITNNPQDLPGHGLWVVRRYDPSALLLEGRRFTVELYTLVSSIEPLRVYVHTEGAIWSAGKAFAREPLAPQERERHCTSPGDVSTSRCPGRQAGQQATMRLQPLEVWHLHRAVAAIRQSSQDSAKTQPRLSHHPISIPAAR